MKLTHLESTSVSAAESAPFIGKEVLAQIFDSVLLVNSCSGHGHEDIAHACMSLRFVSWSALIIHSCFDKTPRKAFSQTCAVPVSLEILNEANNSKNVK